MKIRQIVLDDEEMPSTINVDMTLQEAVFIALVLGKLNDPQANEVMHEGYKPLYQIWSALNGGLFNRYWDSGLDGAKEL